MKYLIDTNILSELMKKKPSTQVLSWFKELPDSSLYLSVLTIGEIRKGVERMPLSKRRQGLVNWLENDLRNWFGKRVLSIDVALAEFWGSMLARTDRPLPAIDSLIAATATWHGCILVTRNVKDFKGFLDLEVLNPFE